MALAAEALAAKASFASHPAAPLVSMVWYAIIMAYHGMVWYGMVCMAYHGMVSIGMHGMVWYGMVWYGMVWYGMV